MVPAASRGVPTSPDRLFVRELRYLSAAVEPPDPGRVRAWLAELDRTGRLVAAGPVDAPAGHRLVLRARDRAEAERALRNDPFLGPDAERTLVEWRVASEGSGVSLVPPPARGAGRLTVLYRISVFVSDPARSLAWYRDVLGLTVRSQDPSTEFLELSLGPGTAGLVLTRPRPEWGAPHFEEGRRRIGTATGIVFRTDNVDALALRLRHAGAAPLEGPRSEPWGDRSLRFADPDGNEFVALDGGPAPPEPVRPLPRRRHRRRPDPADATGL